MSAFLGAVAGLGLVLGVSYITRRRWVILAMAVLVFVGWIVGFLIATRPTTSTPFKCSQNASAQCR